MKTVRPLNGEDKWNSLVRLSDNRWRKITGREWFVGAAQNDKQIELLQDEGNLQSSGEEVANVNIFFSFKNWLSHAWPTFIRNVNNVNLFPYTYLRTLKFIHKTNNEGVEEDNSVLCKIHSWCVVIVSRINVL